MSHRKRFTTELPHPAQWQSWADLVHRRLSELPDDSAPDTDPQGWVLIERALQMSSQALEALQPRGAMR